MTIDVSEWIRCSDQMPSSGQWVLAYFRNELGNGRTIRAYYATKHSIESGAGDSFDFEDYDEANGTSYVPEGWYEANEHEETNWFVHWPVTHWMPLPEPPK